MSTMLVFRLSVIVVLLIEKYTFAKDPLNQDPCKHNKLSCSDCYLKMKMGYCTQSDKSQEMKTKCSSMCGYHCSDGKMASGPFNQGCLDEDRCFAYDRLNQNVITKHNVTNESCYRLRKAYKLAKQKTFPPWIKFHCETTFAWCCPDKKTFADGPFLQNCPYQLCYNVYTDGFCRSLTKFNKRQQCKLFRDKCAWTCKDCKPPSPPSCGKYKCCWNNKPPLIIDRPDGSQIQLCPVCRVEKRYLSVCKQFRHGCKGGQIRIRVFMHDNCYPVCFPGCKRT